jgi:hypothetical protein
MMISTDDRTTLRALARQVADVAARPIYAERRRQWKLHNSLRSARPMILVFPEGSWVELLPKDAMTCERAEARDVEWALRSRLYYAEHFADDTVIEGQWVVSKAIQNSGWGLEDRRIPSPEARGAWKFDPVLLEREDLRKLRMPEISHDEAATEARLAQYQDLFGDILEVKLKGIAHVSYHLMALYTRWRGLEEAMVDMVTDPAMVHASMAFLEASHRRVLEQYMDLNLLSLNNDGTYQNSGGNGYTDELPAAGFDPECVRPCDMWASAESQELAQVSPQHHAEFALPYERRLLKPFGLTGYGCCEDLTRKLDDVVSLPHMRRISISPFANVEACAARLRGDYILSWKPHPAHLVDAFDEEFIRDYIRRAIEAALSHGCVLEMILKDTHTCQHHPERFDRWTQIAREEVQRAWGD